MSVRLPKPPVPKDANVQHFDWMPLDLVRLQNSETWAAASGEQAKALVNLWMRAWHQVPAGSLPDDDNLLATWAGVRNWQKVADFVRSNFVRCSDGRLYQLTLCEFVKRQVQRSEAAKTSAKSRWNKKKPRNANAYANALPSQSERNAMEIEKVSSVLSVSGETDNPEAPVALSTPDLTDAKTQLYHRGKAVLGRSAGGVITKLLAAVGVGVEEATAIAKARAIVETASTRADAREYVSGVIRNQTGPPAEMPVDEMTADDRDRFIDRSQRYAI